jgi:lipid-A-disaccharide synthase
MGLAEVAGRLPGLMGQRRRLAAHFLRHRPHVFIGVDAPDYNLALERRLRRAAIPTVHYVSPSVWAWRRGRLPGILAAADLMLTLFPFEADFYREAGMPVRCVGHPLADLIPLEPDRDGARRRLGLEDDGPRVALLPGSRASEARAIGPVLAATARWLAESRPGLRFIAPMATPAVRERFTADLAVAGSPPVVLVDGNAREVMTAADVVLLASGTAALEALLLKRPMVVTYRMNPLTAFLVRRLVRVGHFSLPNLLAGRELVPERVQEEARPEALGAEVLRLLDDPGAVRDLRQAADAIHRDLRRGGSVAAAEAVLALLGLTPVPEAGSG